ncbi:MAG: RnfABCDGE type electron transport complex subunit D [Clostridiales bacterium]|jgi:electron transport complex protein RnfD|nr:RnfABCDGE type electron transport complex subunit D [Clostridiales bacterium]
MDKHKYMVSGTPHVRSGDRISDIMLDVVIALTPAAVMAAYYFGFPAIALMLVSVESAVTFEFLYQKAMKQKVTVGDYSAMITGLLLAFNLPASAPLWLPIVGSFFAIVLVKQLFGGLGQNFMNPALAARAFLLASFSKEMTNWSALPGASAVVDGVSSATPLALLKTGDFVPRGSDMINALIGNTGGCLGETCAVALIIGGLYLIARQVISWKIPVFYIGTVAVLSFLFGRQGAPVYDLLTGGLLLGAFFMATDYSSSPVTQSGKIIFAVGCGILTMVIRALSAGYPEGVSYSILLMNLAVPLIDRFTKPRVFGKAGKHV